MPRLLMRMWKEDSGSLSFEWVTLTSLMAIGIVGGLASVRDAINDEMADMTEAIVSLDQSYVVNAPLQILVHSEPGPQVRTFQPVTRELGETRSPVISNGGAAGSAFLDRKPIIRREAGLAMNGPAEPVPNADPLEGEF